jgi:hypothetical protein
MSIVGVHSGLLEIRVSVVRFRPKATSLHAPQRPIRVLGRFCKSAALFYPMTLEVRFQFRRLSDALVAQAAVAGGIGHAGTVGHLRELIVARFLRPHLPSTIEIRSGVIIDSKGARSRQQDIVLIDSTFPTISVGADREALIIAESVLATVEVKSFLSSQELQTTLESIAVTRSLHRSGQQFYSKRGAEITVPKPHPILTYVLAFDGTSLATSMDKLLKFCEERKDGGLAPEAICVLAKGTIIRNPLMPTIKAEAGSVNTRVKLPQTNGVDCHVLPVVKDALFRFYGRLRDDVIPLKLVQYDLDPYFDSDDIEE